VITTFLGRDTALVVVDMQVDFGLPSGSLYVDGAEEILEPVNALVRKVQEAGGLVVYTQDHHPAETPHFIAQGGPWPPHGVAGTPGAELLPGLLVAGDVVQKGIDGKDGYSGFSVRDPKSGETSPTVLEEKLRGISSVIVVGLAGDYCVGETALDAVRLGFSTEMPLELTRFVNLQPGDDARMVARVESAGVVVSGSLS
jgi:nicotinamidase/pyrazinamidase